MVRILPIIIAVALAIFAFVECASTPSDRMPARLPKAMWLVAIVLIPLIGPLAWIVGLRVMLTEAASETGGDLRGSLTNLLRRGRGTAPKAPDDDPDFLWKLERDIYRQRRSQGGAEPRPGEKPKPADDVSDDIPAAGPAPDSPQADEPHKPHEPQQTDEADAADEADERDEGAPPVS